MTLALTVSDDGKPQNFDEIGAKLLESNTLIDAVELVPNGVITYIYPMSGNGPALGFDILNSPDHRDEAMRSLHSAKMYFAGPLELQQGGSGIIGRLPVYQNGKFWGFSAVVIRTEKLYQVSGIHAIDESRYYFQLAKLNPVTKKREFFLPDSVDLSKSYYASKTIPDGGWELYLISKNKYGPLWPVLPIVFFGLILAVLFGFVLAIVLEKPAEAVRQSEARFEALFNDSPVALWEEDFSKVKTHLGKLGLIGCAPDVALNYFRMHPETVENCLKLVSIINVNDECLKLHTPKTKQELISTNLDAIIGKETRNAFIKQLTAVCMELSQTTMDTRMRDGNGNDRELFLQWTVMRGYEDDLDRVIISTEDITDRKNAEKIIYTSQQRIESLINTIDGVVWESDFTSDNITFVNKKAEEITGYPTRQWLSENDFWTKHLHPDDRAKALRDYKENVKEHNQFEFEYRFMKSDGDYIWVRDYVNVVKENGKPAFVRGIMLDITKEKESEEKLNESLKLVIEQNKRLQNFSYIVSHNLRSHTSNIQSIAALMESMESESERKHMLNMLRTVSGSLNETMTNLNEVVNIQTNISLVSENLNLKQYIDNTLAVLSEQIVTKKAIIDVNVSDDVEILFNAAYLESILLNLVSNAIRYSSAERQPEIDIEWIGKNGVKSLKISDNGIGIDLKKYGDKIFGMYKTFSNNPDSRGIGLFITKNQIDAMGGTISVESEPGKGTNFVITFK
ncbi:MAG: PAS domain S-box protein [Flavobacterium sp.]|uniref:PAS domain-containing protein n=1 Tax=Flavobacterium sp. TaxID=239 RepID=UPI0011F6C912|nr:PAS domain-containing protein [Flavobacterium sp.]RZJ66153.1 MAG: PAS domain S-box protein [Flavobacterium sp.]